MRPRSHAAVVESKDALQVVGVAADVRFFNPRDPFGFVIYVPLTHDPLRSPRFSGAPLPTGRTWPSRFAPRFTKSTPRYWSVPFPLAENVETHLGNEKLLAMLSAFFLRTPPSADIHRVLIYGPDPRKVSLPKYAPFTVPPRRRRQMDGVICPSQIWAPSYVYDMKVSRPLT
jgi:hypothetical protein